EDVVELLRRTIAAVTAASNPSYGPWVFGTFLYSIAMSAGSINAEFHGWADPLVIFSRLQPRPWVRLLLPDGKSRAIVRQAFLDETDVEELTQLLSLTEQQYGHPSGGSGVTNCEVLSREMGLL